MCDCLLWWNEKQREEERKRQSDSIDMEIEDSRKSREECKILLLGSGESGKSTIVKQMRIIHKDGFPEEERKTYRETIYNNILDSVQAILAAIWKIGIIYPDQVVADQITNYRIDSSTGFVLSPEITQAIAQFWQEPIVGKVFDEHGNEFYLMDSASYFLSEVTRIGSPDYIPTETDVLRARKKTTAISETRFSMGSLSILMIDVGGQRSERRKWIHHFESVISVIFCVALSEYDQVLLEENTQNRMAESLILFESIINSRWFVRSSIILFLNKIDVFKKKLPQVPLERYFPEYTGGDDFNKAAKYILWKYLQENRARLAVFPHLTQATDTTNIRLVFAAVKETISQNVLKDSGII